MHTDGICCIPLQCPLQKGQNISLSKSPQKVALHQQLLNASFITKNGGYVLLFKFMCTFQTTKKRMNFSICAAINPWKVSSIKYPITPNVTPYFCFIVPVTSSGIKWPGVRLPSCQRGLSATGGPPVAEVAVLLLLLLLLQPSGGRSEPQGDGDGEGDGSVTDLSPNTEEVVSSS